MGGHTIGYFLWMLDHLGASIWRISSTFIFNNYCSFVNSLLPLGRSYLVKVFVYVKVNTVNLKNKVPCQAVVDKILGERSAKKFRASEIENLSD